VCDGVALRLFDQGNNPTASQGNDTFVATQRFCDMIQELIQANQKWMIGRELFPDRLREQGCGIQSSTHMSDLFYLRQEIF
jgi:hypothetical protein